MRAPANEFVSSFVGEDRGLRRLGLNTVASLPFRQGAVVDESATLDDAVRVLESERSDWLGITTGGRFSGWATADDVRRAAETGSVLALVARELPAAQVAASSTLRSAMELIMVSNTSVAVIEDNGRFGGIVTLEDIRRSLAVDEP
jgi:osmoprotectant transport system ATP-binding protein